MYDLFQLLLCVLSSVFICLPDLIFRSRVTGACAVTTDCIVNVRTTIMNIADIGQLIFPKVHISLVPGTLTLDLPTLIESLLN